MTPSELFSLLSDPTRLRVTSLLATEGELCVCELTHALGNSQPKISRHLALMREAGLVVARREGTWMHYRIDPRLPSWVQRIVETAAQEVEGTEPFCHDARKLRTMSDRPRERVHV